MADKKFGIEIDATKKGSGLKDAAKEVKQLTDKMEGLAEEVGKANQKIDQLGDEVRKIPPPPPNFEEGFEGAALAVSDLEKEVTKTKKSAQKLGSELNDVGTESNQVGNKTDDMTAALRKANKEFENAKAVSIRLRGQYKRLRKTGNGTAEDFEKLSARIDKAQQAEKQSIDSTRKLVKEFKKAEGQTDEFKRELKALARNLQKAEGYINGTTPKVKELGKGFDKVGNKLDKTGKKIGKTNKRLETLIKKGPHIQAMGQLMASGIEQAASAIYQFGKSSHEAFLNFDKQSREIFTLLPGASAETRDALKRDVLIMGQELGRLPDEMLPAVYNALSAGVPEDNVLETVRIGSEAARAGVAELDTTLKLGVGILNAQVTGVNNINDVYDQLFFTIKNGVVTMPELTEVMSQVTSVAGEAGVSMQDISAAMITMTRQGDSAGEAASLLSTMLTQLSTSGTALATAFEDASGKSFRQFVAAGGTLAEAMQVLQTHAKDTGTALGDMLGGGSPFYRDTQAARGALELTGKHLQEMTRFSAEAEDAMGTMAQAADEMGDAASLTTDKYAASMASLKIAFGELANVRLAPLIADATELINVWSGQRANEVEAQVDALIEKTGDYAEVGQRLGKVLAENDNFLGRVTGSHAAVLKQLKRVMIASGDYTGTNEEITASLEELTGANIQIIDGMIHVNGQYLDTIANLRAANLERETEIALTAAQGTAVAEADARLQQYNYTRQAEGPAIDQVNEQIERQIALRKREAEANAEAVAAFDVQEVLDGDTVKIELEGEVTTVRFRNVNAPEIQHGDKAAMPWATEAMDAAEKYFDKHPLELQGELDRTSYDRIIASVPELEQQLVEKGLAIPLPVELSEDPERYEELKAMAQEAAAAGVGMFEDEALAARVLAGDMVDLGVYYEDLAEQEKLRADAAIAAAEAEAAEIQRTKEAYGRYAIQALDSKNATTNWTDELFRSATAQGISQEQILLLATATGEYTDAEIEAMLKTAAMKLAVEELSGQIAAGDISIQDAITSMQDFETQLDADYTVEFGYEDLTEAKAEAERVKEALGEAEGSYSASFTTTQKTIHEEEYRTSGTPPPSGGNGGPPPNAQHEGGRFRADEMLMVGDGPGGRFVPGLTEFVMFDKPGTVIGADDSAAMFNAFRAGQTPAAGGAAPGQAPAGGRDGLTIQIYVQNDDGDIGNTVAAGVISAAQQIGLTP